MAESSQPGSAQVQVLVPLDGSDLAERAIPYASALAGNGGQLVFLHVIPESESDGKDAQTANSESDGILRASAEKFRSALGSDPVYKVAVGDAAEQILAVAEQSGVQFIVMASHGRGAIRRLAFGSVADRIARATEIPVLIIRPGEDEQAVETAAFQRIVVPYDGSTVAAEALPVAASIASRLNIPVHLLHAINPSALVVPSPMGTSVYSGEIYTEISDELTAAAQSHLDEAKAHFTTENVTVETEIMEGPPALAVEDSAKPGDLVVMSSHGRSGVRRWLLGSTAEKLIRTGPSPVLLVPAASRIEAGRR